MDFKEIVHTRRAVNFFDPDKDIPGNLLIEMVELAAKTPSGFNLQPWNMILLKDIEKKKKLQKLAWNQPKIVEAPVVFIILADRNGWREGHPIFEKNYQEMLKSDAITEDKRQWFIDACQSLYGSTEERQLAFACKNTGFFAMSLMLAAKHLGLDTHPMDGFDHDAVKNAFNIPERYWIPLLLAVGYFRSDKKILPPKWRKSYDEIIVAFE